MDDTAKRDRIGRAIFSRYGRHLRTIGEVVNPDEFRWDDCTEPTKERYRVMGDAAVAEHLAIEMEISQDLEDEKHQERRWHTA